MLKNFIIIGGLAGTSVLNQYIKSRITNTNVFKKIINDIKKQLENINIQLKQHKDDQIIHQYDKQTIKKQINTKFNQQQTSSRNSSNSLSLSQQQIFYNFIINPQISKLLTKKSQNKIQKIRQLKNNQKQNQIMKNNVYVTGIHAIGALIHTQFFYWSAITYCLISQFSMINDLYTLKTGNKLVNWSFKSIKQLYLKGSIVMLGFLGFISGFKRLAHSIKSTKQIIKKQP